MRKLLCVAGCLFLFLLITHNSKLTTVYAADHTYYLHTDHQGSVNAVTDEAGTLVARNDYNPYGSGRITTSTIGNKVEEGYTGQIKDTNTSLSYYHARYYDPVLSRFISPDAVEGGNRYAYVGGNPVSRTDPSGNIIINDGGGGGANNVPPINHHLQTNTHIGDFILSVFTNAVDESYGGKYFDELIQKKLFSNKTFLHEWRNGEMDTLEKLNALDEFVRSSTPYFESVSDLELKAKHLKYDIADTKRAFFSEFITNLHPDRLNQFTLASDRILANILITEKNQLDIINNNIAAHWNNRDAGNLPYKQFLAGQFICANYASLLITYIHKYVPNVKTYAAFINVLRQTRPHVFVTVDVNGQRLSGDPTPRWDWIRPKGFIPLEQDKKDRVKNLDFSSLDQIEIDYPLFAQQYDPYRFFVRSD